MSRHSTQSTQHYARLLSIFRNATAFMPLVLLPVGLLVKAGSINDDFYRDDFSFWLIFTLYSAASLAYFYILKRHPNRMPYVWFQAIFHLLTMAYVLFVAGFLSAFLAVWILLMISADLLYGWRGFWASFAWLGLTGVLTLVVRPETPLSERFEILQAVIVIGLIGYVIARFRGITDREQQALAFSKDQESFERERLLALINSMGDAVMTTDTNGKIKVYNAALLNLLDTNTSLVGQNIDDVMQLRDQSSRKVNIIDIARRERRVFSRSDLAHRFSAEETMRLYINVAPIRPGFQGHVERGFIFILRDITKEKTLEEERDEFISVVSHELRTPVAIAEGNLSNVKLLEERGAERGAILHAVDDAHVQIIYLAKLVNDLGTLARAERGILSQVDVFDPGELIVEISNDFRPQAEAKGLSYVLALDAPLPQLKTSRLYLQEILQNFVTNAVKYTKEGVVTISARVTPKGLRLAVADTGIGISKTDQTKIFQKFYRSEDYRTRETSGTGLGLYVCKKLAEKAGFRIHFESQLNKGSTFYVEVPRKQLVSEAMSRKS